ncbi:hypothetical protein DWZ73_02230 [Bifidobacterium longum]|nr:hypothetical protein BBM1454_10040 [Bifidobacterium breve MCC 1454]RHM30353.1 hypothetical protein DWZ73_02230 [Bifidobacterium longum]
MRGIIKQSGDIYKRTSWISKFDTAIENTDHRSGTGNRKILVNKHICHQFTKCHMWEHPQGDTSCTLNDFLLRQQCFDIFQRLIQLGIP